MKTLYILIVTAIAAAMILAARHRTCLEHIQAGGQDVFCSMPRGHEGEHFGRSGGEPIILVKWKRE